MATNKHALLRYQTLDKCFRNPGRKYFIEDLITCCTELLQERYGADYAISRRQIYADINDMESQYGIDIVKHKFGKRVYYRYANTNFSINNSPLSTYEESKLKEALLSLSRIKGLPHFEWMEEMITRMDAGLNKSDKANPVIHFDQNVDVEGLVHMPALYHSITNERNLVISYNSFSRAETKDILVSPYFLKQYKGRWYLFAWIVDEGKLHDFPLDRIQNIVESETKFIPTGINFDEYFEDVIGVTKPFSAATLLLKLRVDAAYYPYISTKPLHGSQKVLSKNEQNVILQIEVVQNYELQSLLLSYGDLLEVLEPLDFRELMAKRVKRMMGAYEKN